MHSARHMTVSTWRLHKQANCHKPPSCTCSYVGLSFKSWKLFTLLQTSVFLRINNCRPITTPELLNSKCSVNICVGRKQWTYSLQRILMQMGILDPTFLRTVRSRLSIEAPLYRRRTDLILIEHFSFRVFRQMPGNYLLIKHPVFLSHYFYSTVQGADKSLARPGRKQANVSIRMAWISFSALPCRKKKTWWQLASRCCWNCARLWYASELVSFLVGLRTYQHPGKLVSFQCYLKYAFLVKHVLK